VKKKRKSQKNCGHPDWGQAERHEGPLQPHLGGVLYRKDAAGGEHIYALSPAARFRHGNLHVKEA